jgi:hypothetical protein
MEVVWMLLRLRYQVDQVLVAVLVVEVVQVQLPAAVAKRDYHCLLLLVLQAVVLSSWRFLGTLCTAVVPVEQVILRRAKMMWLWIQVGKLATIITETLEEKRTTCLQFLL